MTDAHPFIALLEGQARQREEEEAEFRRTMNARVTALAEARAFANRRMNVMRSLLATVAQADSPEIAAAGAVAALRDRLGWRDDSGARDEVLTEYAKLALAAFAATHEASGEAEITLASTTVPPPDVETALAEFEAWYEANRGKPFWVLFENYMPETQLVDF